MNNIAVFPDFIGIGAQRSGTTWLWNMLKLHPDIWMPYRKELHYFSRSRVYPTPGFLAESRLMARAFGRHRWNTAWRIMALRTLKENLRGTSLARLKWESNYLFGRYDDNWYLSLFRNGQDKVKGEITPAYSVLDNHDIERVKRLVPDCKILLLLRNPIDRAWSMIRYTNRFKSSPPELRRFINSPDQKLRNDYIRILDTWSVFFPPEQFFVGFYDEIIVNPADFVNRIWEFLGVDKVQISAGSIRQRINASESSDIPAEIEKFLVEEYREDLEKLNDRLGSFASDWLRNITIGAKC